MSPTTTNKTQALFALVFVGVIVLGFSGVAYVSYQFETADEAELLYITNANTEFVNVGYADSLIYSNAWYYNTCQRMKYDPNTYTQDNKTMLYVGNNSYSTAVLAVAPHVDLVSNKMIVRIVLPELDNYLINTIVVNSTLPTGSVEWGLSANTHATPHAARPNDPVYSADDSGATSIYVAAIAVTPGETLNEEIDLSLTTSLDIYDKAQEKVQHALEFSLGPSGADKSMPAYDLVFSIEIWGTNMAAWTVQDSIVAILASATLLNIIVAIYATDAIDIGGFTRTLKRKK